MRIDFRKKDLWENLCEQVRPLLAKQAHRVVAEDQVLRVYTGLTQALHELAIGTGQFYTFKKSIAFVSGNSWVFEDVLPYFYKETYQVQNLKHADYAAAAQFVAALNKDTVILLLAEDHPFTGELYPFQELEKLANDKKIFTIRISHQAFHSQKSEILPYSMQIQSWRPDLAIGVLGSKVKTPTLMAQHQYWDVEGILMQIQEEIALSGSDKAAVASFEKSLPPGFVPFFNHERRLFDRSVICFDPAAGSAMPLNGEALMRELSKLLNISVYPPGFTSGLDTANECRWGGVNSYKSWWDPTPAPNLLSSMLMLQSSVLKHPNLLNALSSALKNCQTL